MTYAQFLETYLNLIKGRLKSYQNVKTTLQRFGDYFGPQTNIDDIRRRHIHEYVVSRQLAGVKPSSINVELGIFSAAMNRTGHTLELALENPTKKQRLPGTPGRLRYLTKTEAETLLEIAKILDPVTHQILLFMLHTGVRKCEALTLTWPCVDRRNRIFTIEPALSKVRKRIHLPYNQKAAQVFEYMGKWQKLRGLKTPFVFCRLDGRPIRSIYGTWRKALDLAGIVDFRIHDLRHTFASWLVSSGVELMVVRDLLGHSSIKMTEIYAHLAPGRLRSAVSILDNF